MGLSDRAADAQCKAISTQVLPSGHFTLHATLAEFFLGVGISLMVGLNCSQQYMMEEDDVVHPG
jgi:hypothetical protein